MGSVVAGAGPAASGNDQTRALALLAESRAEMLRYLQRRVNDSALAEDILQESLLKAVRAAPTLRADEQLLPWFRQIVRNSIVDAYRRRAVTARRQEPIVADIPESPADTAHACQCLERLLDTVKPEYADLIRSVDLGGEPTEHAAARLKITAGNLKVRRHRARQALRRRLEETCGMCAQHHCLDCTCQAAAERGV